MMMPYLLASRMPSLQAPRYGLAVQSKHLDRSVGALAAVALAAAGHGLALYWYWSRPAAPPLRQAIPLPTIDIRLAAPVNTAVPPSVAAAVPVARQSPHRPDSRPRKRRKPRTHPPAPLLPENSQSRSEQTPPEAPAAAPVPMQEQVLPPPPEEWVPPALDADYLSHPSPEYPGLARSRRWQGEVMLKVFVREDGSGGQVEIARSSGHEVLDEAALEAVRHWRFVPAKRGGTAVASWVTIPVSFQLDP